MCSFVGENLIALLFPSFVLFIRQSQFLLSVRHLAPFPLITFQINVISFYSPSHSSADLASLRQRVFSLDGRASNIDFSVTDVSVYTACLCFT